LNKDVVNKYFTRRYIKRIEGMGMDEIAKETLAKHPPQSTGHRLIC